MKRLTVLAGTVATLLAVSWLNLRWLERPLNISPIVTEKPAPIAVLKNADVTAEAALLELGAGTADALLRPLFHADRRPYSPPPAEAPAIEPLPAEALAEELPPIEVQPPEIEMRPELILAGVSLAGSSRRVLLGAANGSEMRWYSQGDNIAGWTVDSIVKDAVTMSSGEQRFTLPLYPTSATTVGGAH